MPRQYTIRLVAAFEKQDHDVGRVAPSIGQLGIDVDAVGLGTGERRSFASRHPDQRLRIERRITALRQHRLQAFRRHVRKRRQDLRRGIKDENLAAGFRISGLGQLIESSIQADRMVTFGD